MSDVINALQTTLMALGHSGLLANVNSALFNTNKPLSQEFLGQQCNSSKILGVY